jgi:hypothetical protein
MWVLIILSLLSAISFLSGALLIVRRRSFAKSNADRIKSVFPGPFGDYVGNSSKPAIMMLVGVWAIVIGAVILTVAILVLMGVMHYQPVN